MQLRKTVRLPERLDEDSNHVPSSRQSLRGENISSPLTPSYIDYNPNVPPAAFPTLNTLRRPLSKTQIDDYGVEKGNDNKNIHREDRRRNTSTSLNSLSLLTKNPVGHKEALRTSGLDEIPVGQLNNYMASNGEFNPVWMDNMARMAIAGQDSSVLDDMEDSDLDETTGENYESSSATPQDPTWAVLSPRMHVEIFLNLLQSHNYSTTCRLLGLTAEEYRKLQELLIRRYKQLDVEELHLQSMRAKQLRELLKIDNSSRTQTLPHQLVFRKITRQSFRKLKDAIKTDIDFFCCESSELSAARTFLRKRRIEPKFAGSWGNNTVFVNADDDVDDGAVFEMVGADGCFGLNPTDTNLTSKDALTATTTTIQNTVPNPDPDISTAAIQEAFLSWLGDAPAGTQSDHLQPYGDVDPTASPRWLTLLFKECIEPERKRLTKRKREDCELAQYQERWCSIPPILLSRRTTSYEYFQVEGRALKTQQLSDLHKAAQRTVLNIDPGITSLPLNKDEGYLSLYGREPTDKTCSLFKQPSSKRPLRTDERAGEPTSHSQPQAQDASLPGLVRTSAFIRLSSSPPPQNTNNELLPSSSPEKDIFDFEDLVSIQTAMTTPCLTGVSPGSLDNVEIESLDTGCEGPLRLDSAEVKARSRCAYAGHHEEMETDEGQEESDGGEDEVMDDDEMVLLPTVPGFH
ncbi:hypothetical protein BJX70DRAFT_394996 [Aspergillus crustosus]